MGVHLKWHTPLTNVDNASSVSSYLFWSKMPSNIFLQAPTDPVFTKCASMLISVAAPKKLVPLSQRYCCTGPRTATNLFKTFMNEELPSCSTSSICTARDIRQVTKIPNCSGSSDRLLFYGNLWARDRTERVYFQEGKGGPGSILSQGRSGI